MSTVSEITEELDELYNVIEEELSSEHKEIVYSIVELERELIIMEDL